MKLALRRSFTDRESTVFVVPNSKSLHIALAMLWVEVGELNAPYFVKVNGKIWLRSSWDNELPENAFVEVFAAPAGGVDLAVVSLVLTVASLAYTAYLIMNLPEAPNAAIDNNLPKSENVFSFSGQKNITKLNQTVETSYGENRWFPPYFTLPRIYFVENRAYIEMLFSIGSGNIGVDDVWCGDTRVSDIANSEWEFLISGSVIPSDCVYIGDKTNTELSAPGEVNFETLTMSVTPAGATVSSLQFNYIFNGGLARTVECRVKYRRIDDLGRAINPWSAWETHSFTANTATPQRYTKTISGLTPGRYEVAVERVTAAGSERVSLISAYGIGSSGLPCASNVVRVLLQGSNAIDEGSASDISVLTYRKLRGIENGLPTPTATRSRSAVRAIIDLILELGIPQNIEYAYWEDLQNRITANFDFVYTNKTTVWQALQDMASTFRGQMYVVGSDFRVAIDSPEQTPVAFFGPDNATDLTWSVAFPQEFANDCIEAIYVDPVTGVQNSVQFTPPGSSGANPRSVTLAGVTDRTQAWRTAAYKWLSTDVLRDTVSFTAGMDGLIPMYGDLITVAWPFPAWAQAGLVHYQDTNGDLVVSEELDADGGPNWVSLRNAQGGMHGPVPCTLGGSPNRIVLGNPLPVGMFDFEDFTREATLFTFGKSTTMEKVFRVTSVIPDTETVKIEAVAYDTSVFTYDVIQAPVNDRVPVADPGISWTQVADASSTYYRVVWPAVEGATGYSVRLGLIAGTGSDSYDNYIRNPETYPWDTFSVIVEAFGTTAYIPKNTNGTTDRLLVRIVASSGETAYWRGVENGEPLVFSLGSDVAVARASANPVTFNASDVEMIAKVDPAIGGNCTLVYIVAYADHNEYLEVPVSDTGYGIIDAEVLRKSGFAGKIGIGRGLYVYQNGVVKIASQLTINPISIPVGMDNYVAKTFEFLIEDVKYGPISGHPIPAYLKKRITIELTADATGEYKTEWETVTERPGTTDLVETFQTDKRELQFVMYDYANYTVVNIDWQARVTLAGVPAGSEEDLFNTIVVFTDSNGDQILPNTANSAFIIYKISGFDLYQLKVVLSNGSEQVLTAADLLALNGAERMVALDRPTATEYYATVKARLVDYYGGKTAWSSTLTVS